MFPNLNIINLFKKLELIHFKFVIPIFLFFFILSNDISQLIHYKFIASFILNFIFISIIVIILYRRSLNNSIFIIILLSSYSNTAIYALPLITLLLDNPISAIIANYVQILLIQSLFIAILSLTNKNEKLILPKLIHILRNPLILFPFVGLLLNCLNIFEISPQFMLNISYIGKKLSLIGLLIFSINLIFSKFNKNFLNLEVIKLVTIKNILHPLIGFGIGRYIFDLETYWLYSLIILSSAPTALVIYIISQQFSLAQELSRHVILISSIFSLITLLFTWTFIFKLA